MSNMQDTAGNDAGLWSVRFRKERENQWMDLECIVNLAFQKGLRAVPAEDLKKLPLLYRSTLASLSVARKTALDRHLVAYLEALSVRAYLLVYESRRAKRGTILSFLLETFPRETRKLGFEMIVSALVFGLGILTAYSLTIIDNSWYYAFVPLELAAGRSPESSAESLRAVLYTGDAGGLITFASFLFTHNAQVGMLAFALGFAAGIPTILLLFYNGLVLGAFLALYAEHDLLVPLLGWLLPHGIPEIAAIILCGAAGLHIGRALIWPQDMRVRDAMMRAGARAACIVIGTVILFAVAGIIEGLFRQLILDDTIRFLFAGFNLTWLVLWLFFTGRENQ